MSDTDEDRVRRRVEAIRGLYSSDHDELMLATIRADIAVADEEQAALRSEFDAQIEYARKHYARAQRAEAEVERLTRECLNHEATETDARERLRRCEERLAAVEALHVRTPTDAGPDYCPECSEAAQEWVRWPCPTAAAVKSDQ